MERAARRGGTTASAGNQSYSLSTRQGGLGINVCGAAGAVVEFLSHGFGAEYLGSSPMELIGAIRSFNR